MVLGLFKKKGIQDKGQGKKSYYDITVKDIIRETDDAITIVFEKPDEIVDYKPGQYISLILTVDGQEVRRSYSLSSSPDHETDLAVTVKRVDGGKVSAYIVDQIRPGDQLKIMAPAGNFTTEFDPKNRRKLIFFAGGSGITPLISLMKSALVREPDSDLILVYQNREENSIIFRESLEELKKKYPEKIHIIHVLSQPSPSWKGDKGRLSPEQIKYIFDSRDIAPEHTTAFICGPGGMMETVESTLEELGIDKKRRLKESFFTADPKTPTVKVQEGASPEPTESHVTILLDNETHELRVRSDEFILETALNADIDMPFSCQSGICTSCRGKLISGEVNMEEPEGLSEEEIESGYILTCISHPVSKSLKIDMDQ